jgi:hypothetical protein
MNNDKIKMNNDKQNMIRVKQLNSDGNNNDL